jgi:ABC-2 type transport system ATP-binding protein
VCNRVAILQKGNLIKHGNVGELLRGSEQVLVRLSAPEETQQAMTILQEAKERGADWISAVNIQMDRLGQPTVRVDAPKSHSAEINALLARNNLFAAELHPYVGSLEEIFLQLTTSSVPSGTHLGMAALAGGGSVTQQFNSSPGIEKLSDGKGDTQ